MVRWSMCKPISKTISHLTPTSVVLTSTKMISLPTHISSSKYHMVGGVRVYKPILKFLSTCLPIEINNWLYVSEDVGAKKSITSQLLAVSNGVQLLQNPCPAADMDEVLFMNVTMKQKINVND